MTTASPSRGILLSSAMQEAAERLQRAISSQGGVLVCGEPGSGRELCARAIHLASHYYFGGSVERLLRASMRDVPNGRPFVVVDCTDSNNLEDRLFGARSGVKEPGDTGLERVSEESAVYGALQGTLVIRQVPELPGRLQARLARILRDGEVLVQMRDGRVTIRSVGLRPIATSELTGDDDRVLPELRKRLDTTRIVMPPLRHRREDIPALVRYLLKDICRELRVPAKTASVPATALLSALPWRGNVTELKSLLSTLVLKVPGRLIRQGDVLGSVQLEGGPSPANGVFVGTLKQAREQFEKDYVASVLEQHHGRMAEAAKALGIQRTNLYRKVRQLAVKRRTIGKH